MPSIPFALQVSFPENRLLPFKDSADKGLCCALVSSISEFSYYLQINPNGSENKFRGETWISFQLLLKNKLEFFDPEKKYIVGGKFTVKVNGIFKFERDDETPALVEQQKWDGGELGDEKKDDKKDFTIIVDGDKEIKVHKLILDVRSEVFAAMLNSNMKESKENKVKITDFPFNVVEAAIKLIYHCTFTTTLSMDELMLLQQFLDKYNLPILKAKVEPLLIDKISPATVCRLTNCSVLTNSFQLKEKCMAFLSAAFASKTPLHDFKTLDKDIALEVLENSFYQIVQIKE